MEEKKRAILVVSFGTSYEETRKKTIDRIEQDIQERYADYAVYRAWTSGMIRRKILKRDGIHILDVRGAMEQMEADGIDEVIVQPTHVLNGIENDLMAEDVLAYKSRFENIVIGAPLLTSQEDNDRVVQAVADMLSPAEGEALVLMGHGTEHYANSIYAALDYEFKDMGHKNIFMGTVEAYPAFDSLIRQVREVAPRKVVLAPFMIVAGDHATNDLSGEEEDSWKSRFERAGFEVRCVLKGLGEYPAVRNIFLDHVEASIRELEK
ncbi:MAG: sirohydrochlorin cobaltochelatase [Lachnospiraceae bacterium]|nr:sirohydrochlorin cobaltochelatase [Lachnospiraceae bacterium]